MDRCKIFFIADEWGYTKGGINCVNFDLCNAIGDISHKYEISIYCICTNRITEDMKKDAKSHNVSILCIHDREFQDCSFTIPQNVLLNKEQHIWVGHDIITAKQACYCKEKYGGKLVLIHHMDYEAYYAAKATGYEVQKKIELQHESFKESDYLIAVGPKLFSSLEDKVIDWELNSKIGQIIPGIANIGVVSKSTHRRRIFSSGRIEGSNDSIKQYEVALGAYCKLKKEHLIDAESVLTLFGLSNERADEIEKSLVEKANELVGGFANIKALPYTQERNELYEAIRTSSIVVVPSLSEGFGLVGLEAISAGVPLVLSQNSGLYNLLDNLKLNGYFESIRIKGSLNDKPNEEDVDAVYDKLKSITLDYSYMKKRAIELKKCMLDNNITWNKTAEDFLSILQIPEVSDLERSLLDFLQYEVASNFEIYSKTKIFVEEFISDLSTRINIDKNILNSLKIKNYFEFPVSILELKNDKRCNTRRFIDYVFDLTFELANKYLNRIIPVAKKLFVSKEIIVKNMTLKAGENTNFSYIEYKKKRLKDKILTQIEKKRIASTLTEDDRKVLTLYHDNVAMRHSYLDFEGLATMISNSEVTKISLDKIFAPIKLSHNDDEFDLDFFDIDSDDTDYNYLEDIIKNKRTVILGDPGTGKSTLLKRVVLDACDNKKRCESENERMCVPLRIADFSNWLETIEEKQSDSLDDYIIEKCLTRDCLDKKIVDIYFRLKAVGGILLLLDGMDEVKDFNLKDKIKVKINDFIRQSEDSVFVITSRIVGYDNSLEAEKFLSLKILALDEYAISDYIRKWYNSIKLFSNQREDNVFEKKAERLIEIIKSDDQFKTLAGNPLLLSILVILHYHGISLPNNRIKLYESISKTLLETWIENKGLLKEKYDADNLIMFFSIVAYEIIENSYDTMLISESSLRKLYSEYLNAQATNLSDKDAENEITEFINYISESVGILLKKGEINNEGLYGFLMHRQFTEYFAAIELEGRLEYNDVKLKNIVFNPKWIEVISLMGCYISNQNKGGQKRANDIIKSLLKLKVSPMDELDYNIQMILKLLANNVYIDSTELNQLKQKLLLVFSENNIYKSIQFGYMIVPIFGSNYRTFFYDIVCEMLNSKNYSQIQSSFVILDLMLTNKGLCGETYNKLKEVGLLPVAFKTIMEKYNDTRPFFIHGWNYYHHIFMDVFIDCVNKLEDAYFEEEENLEIIYKYIRLFVFGDNKNFTSSFRDVDKVVLQINKIVERSQLFQNDILSRYYLIMQMLYTFGYSIASGDKRLLKTINDYSGELYESRKLIESCGAVDLKGDSDFEVTWATGSRIIYSHKDGQLYFTFLELDQNYLMKAYDIILPERFTLEDLQKATSALPQSDEKLVHCLFAIRKIAIPFEEKKRLFNYALDKNYFLRTSEWEDVLVNALNIDKELIFKYYNDLISYNILNSFSCRGSGSKLMRIVSKLFSNKRSSLTSQEINYLVLEYKKACQRGDDKQYILYDMIDYEKNPFRKLNHKHSKI